MSVLRTDRLVLRRFTAADVPLLVELDSDPDVIRYADPEYLAAPPTEDQERATLSHILTGYEHGHEFWAAEEDDEGRFIGWFFLRPDDAGEWELGYRLRRAAWGRGLATEGARAVVDHGFETLGLELIYAEAVTANTASINVLEKLGFSYVSSSVWLGMPDRRYELRP